MGADHLRREPRATGALRGAAEQFANEAARYGSKSPYTRFFRGLMFPPLADPAIEREIRQAAEGWMTSDEEEDRRRLPVLLIADGKLDEAAALLAKSPDAKDGQYGMTALLAIVHLMREDDAASRASIDTLLNAKAATATVDASVESHRTAARLALAVLNGGKPPTPEDTPHLYTPTVHETAMAADACLIGLACEKAGHAEIAKRWLKVAVRCEGIGPGRVAAVIRLRALGEEPFK